MVQWLRLCALNSGGPDSIPGQGTRAHMLQLKDCVCGNEDPRSCVPQLRPGATKYINMFLRRETAAQIVNLLTLWKLPQWKLFQLNIDTESVSVSRSVISNSATPWTVAHQAPLSMEFSRQEYWSIQPAVCVLCILHWQVNSLPLCHLGRPCCIIPLLSYYLDKHGDFN